MKRTLKLEVEVSARKQGRKVVAFAAVAGDIIREGKTPQDAMTDVARLVTRRTEYDSTKVKIDPYRGHVGVFSYGLEGYVNTNHVWPDGRVSLSMGCESIEQANDSFRLHVCQILWDHTVTDMPEGLKDFQMREFRSWVAFQLAYRHAHDNLGMNDVESHAWACDVHNNRQFIAA